MAIDYLALSQWGLVPALGILMGITVTLSYHIFYNKILAEESLINDKISSDLRIRVNQFNKIMNPTTQDEKEFAEDISRIVKFKDILEESKDLFKKWMIISAIALIIIGIVFIVWTEKKETIFVLGIFALIIHLGSWNSLRMNYDKLEKFLNGVDPKEILGDES